MEPDGHEDIWHKIQRICDKVTRISSTVFVAPCVVVLVAWVFVFAAFIIGRSAFNVNWQFVEEFTAYWLVLITFFSFPYALWKDKHIEIDVVVKQFSERARSILAVITGFLALVLVCYLISRTIELFSFGLVHEVRSMTPAMVLVWPVYLLIPIGLAVLGLGLLLHFYTVLMRLVRGEETEVKNGEK